MYTNQNHNTNKNTLYIKYKDMGIRATTES